MKLFAIFSILIFSSLVASTSMKVKNNETRVKNLTYSEIQRLREASIFLSTEVPINDLSLFRPLFLEKNSTSWMKGLQGEQVYDNWSIEKFNKISNAINSSDGLNFMLSDMEMIKKDFTKIFILIDLLQIKTLNLQSLNPKNLKILLKNPLMLQITTLNLSDNNFMNAINKENGINYDETIKAIEDAEAILIAKCANCKNLKILKLGYNSIGDDGAKALAESPDLKNLKELDLYGNDLIGDKGKKYIANSIYLNKDLDPFRIKAEKERDEELKIRRELRNKQNKLVKF